MPVRTAHRREHDPLTFAGGPAVFNPEPLAPFIDFFVFGDGEDIIVEIAELFDKVKGREARLDALAQLPGVYVPARFPMEHLEDGRILPPVDAPKIQKRIARYEASEVRFNLLALVGDKKDLAEKEISRLKLMRAALQKALG
jgi:radical SAM superfamily enzyme YgiQ (UPF0313 family)